MATTVRLLVDTGADKTCLHYPDVEFTGIDPQLLRMHGRETMIKGVGGFAKYWAIDAEVEFRNAEGHIIKSFDVKLNITDESQKINGILAPSLLGADVWGEQRLIVDKPDDEISLLI